MTLRPRCPTCPLASRKTANSSLKRDCPEVGGERIAVIGEAPGLDEIVRNEAFVGISEKLLRDVLQQAGVDLDTTLFTNVCMCNPPGNRTPTSEEVQSCLPSLLMELEGFHPTKILTVGATAASTMLGKKDVKITEERGRWVFSPHGVLDQVPIMTTLHPAALLRHSGYFVDFTRDIQKFVQGYTGPFGDPQMIVSGDIPTSLFYIHELLRDARENRSPSYYSLDIETTSTNPLDGSVLSIGISPSPRHSYIFPDSVLGSDAVLGALQILFHSEHIRWVGHNIIGFDHPYMKCQLDLRLPRVAMDTMLAHYCVDERRGIHGLKKLAREYFGLDDYSAPLKKFLTDHEGSTYGDVPKEQLWKYQGMDTAITRALVPHLLNELKSEGVEDVHEMLIDCAYVLSEVCLTGALLDVPYLCDKRIEFLQKIDNGLVEIRELAGEPQLNVRSPKQVSALLFDKLKLPRISGNGTGVEILEVLAKQDKTGIVKKILDTRQLAQINSTYVEGLLRRVEKDNRVRSDFLLHTTETGRLSSRDPNLQNIPKLFGPDIRNAFIATSGWTFVEADYSQLELRIAAWYSRDVRMTEQFRSGEDIHRQVASAMYHKPPEEISYLERYMAKYVDFGILYGRGAPAIAVQLKSSLREAQELLDNFLNQYPQLNQWIRETQKFATTKGYVQSATGRKRRFPLVTKDNKAQIEREAINTPIQSFASDICLFSLCRIHREADPSILRVILTVHDSILMEVRTEHLEEMIPWIKNIMETPTIEDRGVPIVAEIEVGYRWGELGEQVNLEGVDRGALLS